MKQRKMILHKHSKKAFAILFLSIFLFACSHSGINMTRSGETIQVMEKNRNMLPKQPTGFRVGPGDVFRLDASFQNLSNKPFLLERADVIIINFHYDKGVYRIMPGDGLKVSFVADSALDFEAMVRLDGRLTLPKVGDVDAAEERAVLGEHDRAPGPLAVRLCRQLRAALWIDMDGHALGRIERP